MLTMTTEKGNAGQVLLSGSLTRKEKEKQFDVNSDDDHIVNMYGTWFLSTKSYFLTWYLNRGRLIEDIEISVRGEVGCCLHYVHTYDLTVNLSKIDWSEFEKILNFICFFLKH